MLDTNLLMRRALRHVCDQHGLDPNNLAHMPFEAKTKLQELTIAIAEDMRYNQLKYFRPFPHQIKFFNTGHFERRGILAANRIGKTVSTCFETACHLTGRYPEW